MAMNLVELGQILREEREKKSFSIEDVASGLKISARILRALEAGDSAALPQLVYVRGFVSAYGKFLELDVQELLDVEELQESTTYTKVVPVDKAPIAENSKKFSWKFFLIVLVCVVVAAAVWFLRDADLFSKTQENSMVTAEPAPSLATKNPPTAPESSAPVQEVAQAESEAKSASEKSPDSVSSAANGTPEEPATTDDAVEPSASSSASSASSTEATQTSSATDTSSSTPEVSESDEGTSPEVARPAVVPVGPHKVIITSLNDSWIQSSADDEESRQFTLTAGDTFALTFDTKLVLKLGNAGGVRIHYNGEALPAPGKDGEVKTLHFPPQS